jgi:predicted PurR-regulated permease PerM
MFTFKNVRHIRIVPSQQRNQIRSMTKKDFQLLSCLFAQDIAHITCSLGLTVYYVYSTATNDQIPTAMEQAINNFLDNLFNFLYSIPNCTVFFIFISISRAFRQQLKRMIYKIFGKDLLVPREEENRQENVELNAVVVSTVVL